MKSINLHNPKTQVQLAWVLLALMMLIYAVVVSYQVVLRYDTFKATAFDLGNMDQVFWNTIHGRFFEFTNQGADWYGPPTRLGFHVEPIIIPLSVLYLFHADPRLLLVFQTLVLAVGALPVFLLTRKHLPAWPIVAAGMSGAYLLSPSLLGVNIFDFHPVSIATPLLLYAILALDHKRYGWFLLACLLAAMTKEDIPLAVAGIGVLVVWRYKLPRLGTALIVGGVAWTLLAFVVIMPHFSGAQHNNFWYRYEALGSSPGAALLNLFIRPWLFFTTFVTLDRLYYLLNLFRSTGFLALLAPEWLIPALFSLAVNLLSTDPLLYTGVYHYNAPIIPFIMIAAIHGIQRWITVWRGWRGEEESIDQRVQRDTVVRAARPSPVSLFQPVLHRLLALQSVAVQTPAVTRSVAYLQPRLHAIRRTQHYHWQRLSLRMEPIAEALPIARLQWLVCIWIVAMALLNFFNMTPQLNVFWADHTPGVREQHIQQLLAMIPSNASVSASDNLNPHLTDRLYVTVFPEIKFSTSKQSVNNTVQYVIVDLDSLFPEDRVTATYMVNQLVNSNQFRILGRAEGVILLVRRST